MNPQKLEKMTGLSMLLSAVFILMITLLFLGIVNPLLVTIVGIIAFLFALVAGMMMLADSRE